jgi:hypothetical protein
MNFSDALGDDWRSRHRRPIPPAARPELIRLATRLGVRGERMAGQIRTAPAE